MLRQQAVTKRSDKTKSVTNLTSFINSYVDIFSRMTLVISFIFREHQNSCTVCRIVALSLDLRHRLCVFFSIGIQTLYFLLLSEIYNGIGHIVDCNYNSFLQFCLYIVQFKLKNSNSLRNGTDIKLCPLSIHSLRLTLCSL
jgi:hypothetical protein